MESFHVKKWKIQYLSSSGPFFSWCRQPKLPWLNVNYSLSFFILLVIINLITCLQYTTYFFKMNSSYRVCSLLYSNFLNNLFVCVCCLFELMLHILFNNFQSCWDLSILNLYLEEDKVLTQCLLWGLNQRPSISNHALWIPRNLINV